MEMYYTFAALLIQGVTLTWSRTKLPCLLEIRSHLVVETPTKCSIIMHCNLVSPGVKLNLSVLGNQLTQELTSECKTSPAVGNASSVSISAPYYIRLYVSKSADILCWQRFCCILPTPEGMRYTETGSIISPYKYALWRYTMNFFGLIFKFCDIVYHQNGHQAFKSCGRNMPGSVPIGTPSHPKALGLARCPANGPAKHSIYHSKSTLWKIARAT